MVLGGGTHRVQLRHRAPGFMTGLGLSGVASLGLATLLVRRV